MYFEVTPEQFFKTITHEIKTSTKKGMKDLTPYKLTEYKQMNCYLSEGGGYCIKKGDLVSVFTTKNGAGKELVRSAISNKAKTLDCFATYKNGKLSGPLYDFYKKNGFRLNTSMNSGKKGSAYSVQKGISHFVNDNGEVELGNETVVVFMRS